VLTHDDRLMNDNSEIYRNLKQDASELYINIGLGYNIYYAQSRWNSCC